MLKRTLTSIPLLVVAGVMIFCRNWVFHAILTLFAFLAVLEVYSAMKQASFRPDFWPGILYSIFFCPIFLLKGLNGLVTTFAVLCALQIVYSVLLPKRNWMDTMTSLYVLIYPCWFFIFLLLLAHIGTVQTLKPSMDALLLSRAGMVGAIIAPITSDTGAYLVGRRFGRHKLSPNVSPNKTVEGAVGGVVIAVVVMTAIGFFARRYYLPALSVWHYAIMGLINSLLGQAGDLAASALKRFTGVKDYGHIFPGHGGIMDRMDSILFGAMGAYCYLSLFVV